MRSAAQERDEDTDAPSSCRTRWRKEAQREDGPVYKSVGSRAVVAGRLGGESVPCHAQEEKVNPHASERVRDV